MIFFLSELWFPHTARSQTSDAARRSRPEIAGRPYMSMSFLAGRPAQAFGESLPYVAIAIWTNKPMH